MTHIYNKIEGYRVDNSGWGKWLIDLVEISLVCIMFPLSIALTKRFFIHEMEVDTLEGIIFFVFILVTWVVFLRLTESAKMPRTRRYRTMIFHFARVTFILFLGLLVIKVLFRLTSLPGLFVVNFVTILFVVVGFYRFLIFKVLKSWRTYGGLTQNVLIIADAFSDGIIEKLQRQKEWGFRIEAIMTQSKLINAKYGTYIDILSNDEELKSVIDKKIIDEVIYCKRDVDINLITRVVDVCNEIGIIFRLQSSVSPLGPTEFQLKILNKSRDLSLVDVPSNHFSRLMKTVGDIYFSFMAMILLLPVFLVIAIIIRAGSKGPVIFKQERVGQRGRKFQLYKFRTMVVEAEEQKRLLRSRNEVDGPVFKIKDDPRITRVGKFLRSKGLDELPQLFNVIKGDMSLIGPRPPLEEETAQYERWQLQRLSVKPGITCSWQVIPNRHELSFEEWMELDLHYIDNWNLVKDIGLFFKTVRTFFTSGGH